jgi:hypothetical protein
MNDRVTTITSTQAGKAFPQLARFLAEDTTIAPDVAEQALQATCRDYIAAEQAAGMRANWSRAAAAANASRGLATEEALPLAVETPVTSWGVAVETANRQRGAI